MKPESLYPEEFCLSFGYFGSGKICTSGLIKTTVATVAFTLLIACGMCSFAVASTPKVDNVGKSVVFDAETINVKEMETNEPEIEICGRFSLDRGLLEKAVRDVPRISQSVFPE